MTLNLFDNDNHVDWRLKEPRKARLFQPFCDSHYYSIIYICGSIDKMYTFLTYHGCGLPVGQGALLRDSVYREPADYFPSLP